MAVAPSDLLHSGQHMAVALHPRRQATGRHGEMTGCGGQPTFVRVQQVQNEAGDGPEPVIPLADGQFSARAATPRVDEARADDRGDLHAARVDGASDSTGDLRPESPQRPALVLVLASGLLGRRRDPRRPMMKPDR